jgi:phosphopantothenoylcysteine decarboxylase / phosphopantothenate---cysteine ligase
LLKGKKILLGVTGSIAAYKAAYLVRLLIKSEAEVKVIMTPASFDFITPLTLSTLSKNPVYTEFVADKNTGVWNNHIELGMWADLMIIAPASANTIAKMATGICDNLLLATYLSARCKVMVAPAMDLDMYKHSSTRKNLSTLISQKVELINPEDGELASGLFGVGRLAEPEEIFSKISAFFKKKLPLKGKKVLITAGPTYEAIDPVRFIGNHSSGKMGFALAEAALELGAQVTLITGPVSLTANEQIRRINVVSADEMFNACVEQFPHSDITIMSAAVADYKPENTAKQKIKKTENAKQLILQQTKDILLHLGKMKKKKQLLVGFALETDNEKQNALKKLKEKNLDIIVLNSMKTKGAGFGFNTNKVSIISKNNNITETKLKDKAEIAYDIFNQIINYIK